MRIVICHERFLFRFGVDRVLLALARGFTELGHEVVLLGNEYDEAVAHAVSSRAIRIPRDQSEYAALDEFTASWLEENWGTYFGLQSAPDVVVVAGWPFFSSIPFLTTKAWAVIFSDHGLVPMDGYSEPVRQVLEKLRRLRSEYLRYCSAIVGVSDFIVQTQSRRDVKRQVPLHTVYNGADHFARPIWAAENVETEVGDSHALHLAEGLRREGKRLILNLGRWETECYKNSEASLAVLRAVRQADIDAHLMVLAGSSDVDLPPDLDSVVHSLGFLSDDGLLEIMKRVDLGISVSQWEGFNLPLAEMQQLGQSCLAFDLGAHPETIVHSWFLCADLAEMSQRAVTLLRGEMSGDVRSDVAGKREAYRDRFTWDKATKQYLRVFEEAIASQRVATRKWKGSIVIDVSNASRDPANSGVIRLCRQLSRELQAARGCLFVIWNEAEQRYVLPTREEFEQLGRFNGPKLLSENLLSDGYDSRIGLDEAMERFQLRAPCLLLPELQDAHRLGRIQEYAGARGFATAAIFCDAIPIMRPDLCSEEIRSNHGGYVQALAKCDVVVPISHFSEACLREIWRSAKVEPCSVVSAVLPGEFRGVERTTQEAALITGTVEILCVSTIEPRKNHEKLVAAMTGLQEHHPEFDWRLTLVGNRYAGAEELAASIEAACEDNPRIQWLRIVDDERLAELYGQAHFTVYPSLIEGFGLPIVESIWHGRPCICSQDGVMSELARSGGCLTTDVSDVETLADSIYTLATNRDLYSRLAMEAIEREAKTWADYGNEVSNIIERAYVGRPEASMIGTPTWPD